MRVVNAVQGRQERVLAYTISETFFYNNSMLLQLNSYVSPTNEF